MRSPSNNPEAGRRRHSILAVDDTPHNLLLIKGMLGNLYDLTLASSGEEALAAAASTSFDLVLLDVMMPKLDGFETLKRLRAQPGFSNTPVIFVTADRNDAVEQEGLSLGAVDYIVKPLVIELVQLRINNVLRSADLQKQLALALDSAELGLWEWDVTCDRVSVDLRRGPLLEAAPRDGGSIISWGDFVHPADRQGLEMECERVLAKLAPALDIDVKLRVRGGEWAWAHIYGTPTRSAADGQILQLAGTYRNIERRKKAEAAMQQSEERLRLVMEATGEGVWDWSVESDVFYHNAAWGRILGLDDHFAEHRLAFFKSLVFPDDLAGVEAALSACLYGGNPYFSEHRLCRLDGRTVWVEDRGKVVEWSQDGRPLRMVGSIKDITERKQAEAEIQRLAFHDFLTGLPNRRLLIERLQQVLLANTRNANWSALIFLDMDRFKQLNDTFGHEAGDALLVEVGRRLKSCVRNSDTVARLGGDEFVVMLTSLGKSHGAACRDSRQVGQKILCILNEPYLLANTQFQSTPSLGLAVFSGAPASAESVLRRADQAMYQAKASGRNCLRLSEEADVQDAAPPGAAAEYLMNAERIDGIIEVHRSWVGAFRTSLSGSSPEGFCLDKAHDHRSCELGHWLASAGSLGVLGGEVHERASALHERFHAQAGDLASMINNKAPVAELEGSLPHFDALSKQLVSLLIRARAKI